MNSDRCHVFLPARVAAASLLVAASASAAFSQAPATAQVWDVRYIVDTSGPFSAGPTATQVGITIFARVGILQNTSGTGTGNLGPSRVGGFSAVFSVTDPAAAAAGSSQGTLSQGLTRDVDGNTFLDTLGRPLAGHFAPFRSSFSPGIPGIFGSNDEDLNGQFVNPLIGPPTATRVVGSRPPHVVPFGALGIATAVDSNPANLIGDLTPVYRFYYTPAHGDLGPRQVTFSAASVDVRYVISDTPLVRASIAIPIPDQTVTFLVPGPGAGALALAAGLLAARRRRGWPAL
jgi:hypothetical protein